MKYDVFISYSRRDYIDENKQPIPGNIISKIKELFDNNGISYWIDEEGVLSGDAFAPVIARNIRDSRIFLFISSEHSNSSEWTSNEIATANAYNKKIIPLRYDNSVYNDSVIMYIARLDYIDYHTNPSKSLERLMSSVKEYIKAEEEQKELERLEEERRRNAEINRRERATKLQQIREHIKNLESRKFELEQEILSQERSLAVLRNEKRIIEVNLKEAQDEESNILGVKAVDVALIKSEKVEATPPKTKEKRSHKSNFLAAEWAELKSAMSVKHRTVNYFYILACVVALLCSCLFCVGTYGSATDKSQSVCRIMFFSGLIGLLGLYRVMKNQRDGLLWLFVSLFSIAFICDITGLIYYYFVEVGLVEVSLTTTSCICAYILSLLVLLIRKNKKSAWSQLQKRTKALKDDTLFIAIIVFTVMMVGLILDYTTSDYTLTY